MFLAHLPAGYLLGRQAGRAAPDWRGLALTACLMSLLPDTDLLWFYLVDNRQSVHHAYLFHWPLFWIALAGIALGLARILHRPGLVPYIGVSLAALLLHMLLDSVAGGITWLAPFSEAELLFVRVPARHDWWVWNFVLHWTMALEIAIIAVAGLALRYDLRRRGQV